MSGSLEIIESETLEQKVNRLEKALQFANQKLAAYEQNGTAKLYYSLNKKMNEMADILNENSLASINLDDPKDKSFDRIFKLLEKSETVANSAKTLGTVAGVTNDEEKDINRKPFVDTIAEKRN
jgi:hypothetical protein